MVIDCHVHVSACTPGRGWMSKRVRESVAFRFMQWRLGLKGYDAQTEFELAGKLATTLGETTELNAAVVLAFDAVHDKDGRLNPDRTHLYVTNDYVIELAARHPKMLFGASVHPYRKDAAAEVERCAKAGAVLLKWLPIVQDFNPADERCFAVYEVLAHYKLPLLSHTGGEKSLPNLNFAVADPMLLEPALRRGVTVIAAHCGTRSTPFEPDFVPQFMWLAQEHEHLYGDTSALGLPTRWYAWDTILRHPVVHRKLIHGSDWPIPPFPPVGHIDARACASLMRDANWMRRDVRIKQRLGLDEDYWHRAGKVLRLPAMAAAPASPGDAVVPPPTAQTPAAAPSRP